MKDAIFIHGKGNGHITQAHSFSIWYGIDTPLIVTDNKDKINNIKSKFGEKCEIIVLNTKTLFHSIIHILFIIHMYNIKSVYNFNCYQVNIACFLLPFHLLNISHQPIVNTFYYKRVIDKWSFKLFKHKFKCFLNTFTGINIILSYRPFYLKNTLVFSPFLDSKIYTTTPHFLGYGVAYINTYEQFKCILRNYLDGKINSKLVIVSDLNIKIQCKSTLSVLNNIQIVKYGEINYIQLLANCNYVITSGGFQNIAEAFILQKPVFALPDKNNIEQILNCKDALQTQMIVEIFDTNISGMFFRISSQLYKFKPNTFLKTNRRKWLQNNKVLINN